MLPLISVIIPVYNAEQYLDKCISSICCQNIREIEIILVNDGSTDGSGDICEKWEKKDKRIIYIRSSNQGVSVARNNGMKIAKGEWICFIDADDYIKDDFFSCAITVINPNRNADIFIFDYFYVTDETIQAESFWQTEFEYCSGEKKQFITLDNLIFSAVLGDSGNTHTNVGVPWGKLYRKDFLVEKSITFPVGLKRMQDTIFNLYAFYEADSIIYTHIPVYYYVRNTGSAVNRYTPDFEQTVNMLLDQLNDFGKSRVDHENWNEIIKEKRIRLFLEWCRLGPCHKDCRASAKEKLESLRAYKKKLLSDDLLEHVSKYSTFKHFIVYMLLKYNCDKIFMLYMGCTNTKMVEKK